MAAEMQLAAADFETPARVPIWLTWAGFFLDISALKKAETGCVKALFKACSRHNRGSRIRPKINLGVSKCGEFVSFQAHSIQIPSSPRIWLLVSVVPITSTGLLSRYVLRGMVCESPEPGAEPRP